MTVIEMRGATLRDAIGLEISSLRRMLHDCSGLEPRLATITVGRPPATMSYRTSIGRTFTRLGIDHVAVELPPDASQSDVLGSLRRLNADPSVTGIMAFLPLLDPASDRAVRETLSPLKDVDGITLISAGRLRLALPCLMPSCPLGGIALLHAYKVPIAGANAVVIGRSPVVGGPLATMLTTLNATVTVCHRHTVDLIEHTRRADILAVAAGQPAVITQGMTAPGAAILDFGTNIVDGVLTGDIAGDDVRDSAGWISPVPGGTGPATSLLLAMQTVIAGFAQHANDLAGLELLMPSLRDLVDRLPRLQQELVGITT